MKKIFIPRLSELLSFKKKENYHGFDWDFSIGYELNQKDLSILDNGHSKSIVLRAKITNNSFVCYKNNNQLILLKKLIDSRMISKDYLFFKYYDNIIIKRIEEVKEKKLIKILFDMFKQMISHKDNLEKRNPKSHFHLILRQPYESNNSYSPDVTIIISHYYISFSQYYNFIKYPKIFSKNNILEILLKKIILENLENL